MHLSISLAVVALAAQALASPAPVALPAPETDGNVLDWEVDFYGSNNNVCKSNTLKSTTGAGTTGCNNVPSGAVNYRYTTSSGDCAMYGYSSASACSSGSNPQRKAKGNCGVVNFAQWKIICRE